MAPERPTWRSKASKSMDTMGTEVQSLPKSLHTLPKPPGASLLTRGTSDLMLSPNPRQPLLQSVLVSPSDWSSCNLAKPIEDPDQDLPIPLSYAVASKLL